MRKNPTVHTCRVCGKQTVMQKWKSMQQKTCGSLECRAVVNRIKRNCATCGKEMILSKASETMYCCRECVKHNTLGMISWIKDPKNKEELKKRGKIGGKLGYKTLVQWKKNNPELAHNLSAEKGRATIKKRKERGTYFQEMHLAGLKGSRENKIKAANIEVQVNVCVNGKELDFVFIKLNTVIEFHPIHGLYDTFTIEEYTENRRNIVKNSVFKDYKLLVFTKINKVKDWIKEVNENGSQTSEQ